jgi:uncharacterized protein (TIGR02646 family)
MIQVPLGVEPTSFANTRNDELTRVRALGRTPKQIDLGDKYTDAGNLKWEAQSFKCCYCELLEQRKRNDVEHYRPKAAASRVPGHSDTHGYWWLTWSWDNLFFSCRNCNQHPAKGIQFPLDSGSEALIAEQAAPGKERPLLVNPATEDGTDHIRYEPRPMPSGGEKWWPLPRNGSERGRWTIKVCQLDRWDLLTRYTTHVDTVVREEVKDMTEAFASNDQVTVARAWDRAKRRLLSPSMPLVGLSYDALDHLIPSASRTQWGLAWQQR